MNPVPSALPGFEVRRYPAGTVRSADRPSRPLREPGVVRVPGHRSGTLALARAAADEVHRGNRADLSGVLFLGACAAVVVGGAAVRIEQFLSGWSTFENFVRALLG